ncbi:MAG: hypothetical protein ABR577_14620 [Pyrinomonadaceae bacterium]
MSTISEQQFLKLCAEVYADRHSIYAFNPNMSRREAVLWMLAGCLYSLLSVPLLEQPGVCGAASDDPYLDAIIGILQSRTMPPFDARPLLAELSEKITAEVEDA